MPRHISNGVTASSTLILERDGCQATDLVEQFLLDKSTVSRQVGALEKLGYLEREVDPGNRRNHILHATAAGRTVAKEAERRRREASPPDSPTGPTPMSRRWRPLSSATTAATDRHPADPRSVPAPPRPRPIGHPAGYCARHRRRRAMTRYSTRVGIVAADE
ncbi:MarR family transcriptional regulator [Nocardia sp. NPDC058497]|uniref:MarR family winged helix-turn-helix transcriptional regulator n=1 Tax=Nocardia sp. NPDC058497 TaxID=3346529 RepID=UPI003655B065